MELRNLRLFVAVAQLGSFVAAARQANLEPSLVSRSIANLEAQLGVRLFQRSTRKVRITEAGSRFLARILPSLEELERAADEVKSHSQTPRGNVRITASTAFGQLRILPLVNDLLDRFPELELDCILADEALDLVSENIDFAIRLGPQLQGDFVVTKLFDTRYRICASPRYLESRGAISTPLQLLDHGCVCFGLPGFDRWRFKQLGGRSETIIVNSRLRFSAALGVRQAALAGLGPALLADWLCEDSLAGGELTETTQ